MDLLVANDVAAEGVGFGHETNAVTIFHRGGEPAPRSRSSPSKTSPKPSFALPCRCSLVSSASGSPPGRWAVPPSTASGSDAVEIDNEEPEP